VLFIDIDLFKQFNDAYGHATGDEVLITVAECIASVARRSVDLVARYGGEEFAVVLPETPALGAYQVADKIRRKVEDMSIVLADGATAAVTVSIGCASCVPVDGMGALELLAAADEQLYAAKAAGRNQVKSAVWAEAELPQDSVS
jgi:diguanylate cyclase (GGDEF)-like protein